MNETEYRKALLLAGKLANSVRWLVGGSIQDPNGSMEIDPMKLSLILKRIKCAVNEYDKFIYDRTKR